MVDINEITQGVTAAEHIALDAVIGIGTAAGAMLKFDKLKGESLSLVMAGLGFTYFAPWLRRSKKGVAYVGSAGVILTGLAMNLADKFKWLPDGESYKLGVVGIIGTALVVAAVGTADCGCH